MASTSSPTQASSPALNSALTWDVFLSYRGPDTGPTFTAHLYTALDHRHRINTYKDDYKLRQGEVITEALRKAIKVSKIYIVVFSEGYASSPWCLDELVDIVSFHETEERLIIPVFYNIDPSTVRHVSGIYEKDLQVHAEGYYKNEKQRVNNWLHALKVAANISGSHVCQKNREEPNVIEKIIAEILPRINPKSFDEETVGLGGRIESIVAMLSSGVTKIGIHGMGGVGKTTLSRAVFDKIYLDFEGSCFLANVTENSGTDEGMKSLQQKLLNDVLLRNEKDVTDVASGKKLIETKLAGQKILVVIDDLNHSDQLESLGVKSFAHGSAVIITTRDEDILKYFEVKTEHRHMVNKLGPKDSLILFEKHAFRSGSKPDDALMELSTDILSLADGLPLALKVFGSFLRTKYEVDEWREFIEKLRETPNQEIQDRLLISFNAIKGDPQLKKMFLDISCFFNGWQKERVFEILETYYSYVNVKINNLKGRCLLTIDDRNVLHMHDLLRDMGREVARNDSLGEPEKYSRLWLSTDVQRVLTEENEESKGIEGIYYEEKKVTSWKVPLATKTFKKMKNLRFFRLVGFKNPTGSFDQTFKDLRWLCWKSCPLQDFPPEFKPVNLGILELQYSRMRTLKPSMVFQKLKILNMEYSSDLATSPDFNMLPSLVILNFAGCKNLNLVHRSIGRLAGLVSLNLSGCLTLARLPETIGNLKALKQLDVSYCRGLVKLPEEMVNIESLEELKIRLNIKNLPQSINLLSNLIVLDSSFNKNLITLPDNICKLRSLEVLNVGACYKLKALPEELGAITSLKELDMSTTSISDLPGSIGNLSNLVKLISSHNPYLETLPDKICNLRSLKILRIENCKQLKELPGQMRKLTSLSELNLEGTTMLKVELSQIPLSLLTLDLSMHVFTALPLGISQLTNLECLKVNVCSQLLSIEELPPNLKELSAYLCPSIKIFRAILKQLEILNLRHCDGLEEIQGLDQLASIKQFDFKYCRKLWSITGFPPNLKSMSAYWCSSLKRLPNLSNLKHVERMDFTGCVSLTEIQGLGGLSSIKGLYFGHCSLALLQHILTKRLFQTYSRFENVIQICLGAETYLPSWMSQLCDSESRRVSLDLIPSRSHDFLGTIICFKKASVYSQDTYSIKNITSGFIWSSSINKYQTGRYIIIVPKSVFSIENDDRRIEFTAAKIYFSAVHLLYND